MDISVLHIFNNCKHISSSQLTHFGLSVKLSMGTALTTTACRRKESLYSGLTLISGIVKYRLHHKLLCDSGQAIGPPWLHFSPPKGCSSSSSLPHSLWAWAQETLLLPAASQCSSEEMSSLSKGFPSTKCWRGVSPTKTICSLRQGAGRLSLPPCCHFSATATTANSWQKCLGALVLVSDPKHRYEIPTNSRSAGLQF